MSAPVSDAVEVALDLCRRFEGLYLKPYICPAGVPTIGFGSTRYENGMAVQMTGASITQAQAESLLRRTIERDYMIGVIKASPTLLAHPSAFGALISFAYNLGVPRYRASTLRLRVNANDWAGAREQLALWVRGGGRVLPGLVRRRAAEAALLQ